MNDKTESTAAAQAAPAPATPAEKHAHYFRDVSRLQKLDIYRFLELFGVTDPCLQHAIKKLVVPGMRGGKKTVKKDIAEAIDTLLRKIEMMGEDVCMQPALVSVGTGPELEKRWRDAILENIGNMQPIVGTLHAGNQLNGRDYFYHVELKWPRGPGEVLGAPHDDFPEDLKTFNERAAYQRGVGDCHRANNIRSLREQSTAWSEVFARLRGIADNIGLTIDEQSGVDLGLKIIDALASELNVWRGVGGAASEMLPSWVSPGGKWTPELLTRAVKHLCDRVAIAKRESDELRRTLNVHGGDLALDYKWKGLLAHTVDLNIIKAMRDRIDSDAIKLLNKTAIPVAQHANMHHQYDELLAAAKTCHTTHGIDFVKCLLDSLFGVKKVADVPYSGVSQAIRVFDLLVERSRLEV